MVYDSPTTINATAGFGSVLTYINTVTDGWISNMLLIAVYIISLMSFAKARDDIAGAFAVSGFATFIVALLFWLGGFINGIVLGIVTAMAIIGIIALFFKSEQG